MKRLILGLIMAAAVAGCSDTTVPLAFRDVQVSFATQSPVPAFSRSGPTTAPAIALDDTLVSGADTLILTSAEIVLREVELKRSDVTDCDSEPDDDGCQQFAVGPVLVSLPLQAGAEVQFELDIPQGTYSEIEFDIHKVSDDDPADAAFRQAHPEFIDQSIRVAGTFNGAAFVFETDLGIEQELDLSPPLVVDEGSDATNVTVFVNLDVWFRDLSGNLINPVSGNKGEQNESLVKENIKDSFEAFEDEDRDGSS